MVGRIQDTHTHEIVYGTTWITESSLMAFFHSNNIRLIIFRILLMPLLKLGFLFKIMAKEGSF